jgi:hypothetical protein
MTLHHPENDLYDAACVLLDAAQQLRRAAEDDHPADGVVVACLACLTAALGELTTVCAELARDAREPEAVEAARLRIEQARCSCDRARARQVAMHLAP